MALRLLRTQRGWTLAQLREKLARRQVGVDSATIQRWETGRTPTNHREIAAVLGAIFGCTSLAFYNTPTITFDVRHDEYDEPFDD